MDAVVATSEAQRNALWAFRHSVSEANKKAGVGLTTDCAVPVSAVPSFIARATEAVRVVVPDLPMLTVAHLGDGNAMNMGSPTSCNLRWRTQITAC